MQIKLSIRLLTFLLLIVHFSSTFGKGFLKADGKNIVDSAGNEILLKGIGIGGWWIQEGYMFDYSSFAATQHDFKKKIEDLVGSENTEIFYDAFRKNFVTKADIDSIASWGFNSIRLPMHYNLLVDAADPDTFVVTGFELIDSLLAWCKEKEIYLILDLHAAPGGQGHDAAISDYDSTKPSLWESQDNKDLTVILWKELARRYANKEWIGGYDLINEPNWDVGTNNVELRNLYVDITNAIREVDTNHILFIEGNWYATDFNGLFPPWDDNMVFSFHKYWNNYNLASIQYLIDLRNNYNIPLWLGETGENSNYWFTQLVKLLNQNKIGWACWPFKKVGSVAGHLTINKPEGYQNLLDYWNGNASKPSVTDAMDALMDLTDNLKLENCTYHPDVNYAWMKFPGKSISYTVPFKHNVMPGIIFCSEYDYGVVGGSYVDSDYQNIGSGSTSWNSGGQFRNDGVDMEACTDVTTNGYNVGWTAANEWMAYTIDVPSSNFYSIAIRYAGQTNIGKMHIEIDDIDVTGTINLNPTGGWQTWNTKTFIGFHIESGIHQLKLVIEAEGFNINYLELSEASDIKTISENNVDPFSIIQKPSGKIFIEENKNFSSKSEIRLFDLTGNCLLTDRFSSQYQMEPNLPSGIYIISVANAEYLTSHKIIIKN
jgi:endoglucanase